MRALHEKKHLSAITWSVEQPGHAAAVGDPLLAVLGAGGDGRHLRTQTQPR